MDSFDREQYLQQLREYYSGDRDRIDQFLEDMSDSLDCYLKEHPDAELEAAFSVPDSVDEYAVPVKKGETELLDAIQTAIDELKADGTLSKLSENYFDADFTEAPDSES